MDKYIISIDASTTGITLLVINKNLKVLKKYYSEFSQYFPKPGWVEHDGKEIWGTLLRLMKILFKEYSIANCLCIGITNQRETTLIWNRNTNKPIHKAIVWQCKRTSFICDEIKSKGFEKEIQEKTGLVLDSYFSGTKIKWLLDNVPNAREQANNGELLFGTIDTWLLWNLTCGASHFTDHTNASRTLIYNINTNEWDNSLLNLFEVPKSILPKIANSSDDFGLTSNKLFGKEIPITGIAGDQQASLFGQSCFYPGDAKCTYGTGCFLLTNIGKKRTDSSSGLITTICCDENGLPSFAIEGSVFIGGAAVQWLRDDLQIIKNAKDTEKISKSLTDNNGVYIVPAFTGLGAPYWNMNAKGIIVGLTRGTNRNHLIRATLESIAFQVYDIFMANKNDLNLNSEILKVDGGAANNNFLLQFQANILNIKISKSQNIDSTALGASMLAGIGANIWNNNNNFESLNPTEKVYIPSINPKERKMLINGWKQAIKACQTI
tara:strand:- start:195 stop:1673 length:1479 start_codon:yes stop_codon:yes gene_type:complete